MEMLGFGPSHNKAEILWTQTDQDNSPELLNRLLKHISQKRTPQMTNKTHKLLFPISTPFERKVWGLRRSEDFVVNGFFWNHHFQKVRLYRSLGGVSPTGPKTGSNRAQIRQTKSSVFCCFFLVSQCSRAFFWGF